MLPAPAPVRLVAASAALVGLLAACNGTQEPSGSPSSSPASAASTPQAADEEQSPSSSASATPRPPKAGKGPNGQRAFARFVMDAWSWSLITNDASPLLAASPSRTKPCEGCRRLERELANRADEGWYVDFPGLTVGRTRLARDGTTVTATTRVDIPESDSFFEDGTYRSSSPAHPDATFRVRMRLVDGDYRLLAFSVV